ncbi:MAG: hypothetical protein AB8G77_13075 [Rhodothermales bacterium]
MSETRKALTKKASRRFLFGVIVVTLILAFLSALGIKSAAENEAFQDEVLEMRRIYDPNFEEPDTVKTTVPIASPDSAHSN